LKFLSGLVAFLLLLSLPNEVVSQNANISGASMGNVPQEKYIRNLFFKWPPDSIHFDKEPMVIKKVEPKYPKKALADSVEGDVLLKVLVDTSGNAVDPEIISSENRIFNQAALTAARQWKFTPAVLKGEPVAVWVSIPFRFRLKH
jgi:TonB family protein